MKRILAGLGLLLASAAPAQDAPTRDLAVINAPLPDDQAALKAHVLFLADDVLRGREASSPEFMIAAHYVAAQFYAAGLRPAGDKGGYLQDVPLVAYRAADHGDVVLSRGGTPQPLVFGEDYTPGAVAARKTTTLDAPVVFVGQGIVAPGYKRDDYAGVDVRGKIVAILGGVPSKFQSEERAHFASPATKAEIAAQHGAVGMIVIAPRATGRAGAGWDRARTTWANPDGTGYAPGVPILATLSAAGGAKLFAGAKTPWATIVKGADNDSTPIRAQQLPGTLTVSLHTAFEPSHSANVAGLLPGSDPRLKDEVVVLSAHLDHLGVGRADTTGDTIYNGAEDNATGIASLIEEAKRFKASGKPPRRSILFLAVTAEEKGLVGSDYFARHPTLPIERIVADVNLDMPILTYAFQDMTVFGADRSTLGPIVSKAVAALGVTMSPDPDPSQGIFVRSDHYRFVQQGVPSVFLWPGQAGDGKAAWADFFAHHYHQPSDEIGQKLDWAQGVRFVAANYAIAREIADGDARPRWNKGDFFGLLYHGYGAK
ncbi:MAG TPA: M28 family metallopeptidase [Sphingomonas sp.]|nr:M28 family metallopeptidase [Sphingomonas sp.]